MKNRRAPVGGNSRSSVSPTAQLEGFRPQVEIEGEVSGDKLRAIYAIGPTEHTTVIVLQPDRPGAFATRDPPRGRRWTTLAIRCCPASLIVAALLLKSPTPNSSPIEHRAVPPPSQADVLTYRVQLKDTLESVALLFGVTQQSVVDLNHLTPKARNGTVFWFKVGDVIVVPKR